MRRTTAFLAAVLVLGFASPLAAGGQLLHRSRAGIHAS
jgi:hypothetical protein